MDINGGIVWGIGMGIWDCRFDHVGIVAETGGDVLESGFI